MYFFVLKYLFATVTKLSLLHVVEIGKKGKRNFSRDVLTTNKAAHQSHNPPHSEQPLTPFYFRHLRGKIPSEYKISLTYKSN